MSLMMRVSQRTREGHHGQEGRRAPATLAVNRGIFLGAPRPVEGHRRHFHVAVDNFLPCISLHVLPEYMLQICIIVSTLLLYVGRSVMPRSTQYIRF